MDLMVLGFIGVALEMFWKVWKPVTIVVAST
jgi:hypothetical protein